MALRFPNKLPLDICRWDRLPGVSMEVLDNKAAQAALHQECRQGWIL